MIDCYQCLWNFVANQLHRICSAAFLQKKMAGRGRPRCFKRKLVNEQPEDGSKKPATCAVKTTKQREQQFLDSYAEAYPCIVHSSISPVHARCKACCMDFKISHGGFDDVFRHVGSAAHKAKSTAVHKSSHITSFLVVQDQTRNQRRIRCR